MLANPNLTPIGYTDKKFDSQEQAAQMAAQQGGAPGGMPGVAAAGMMPAPGPEQAEMPAQMLSLQEPGAAGAPPGGMTEALAAEQAASANMAMQPSPSALSAFNPSQMMSKSLSQDAEGYEWDIKADESTDSWTEILDRNLERFIERQQRVVMEKAGGAKARKSIETGSLDVESIFDISVWNKQIEEDLRPVFSGILKDASQLVNEQTSMPIEMDEEEVKQYLDAQVERVVKTNSTTKEEVASAILIATALSNDEDRVGMLKAALAAIFINLLSKRKRSIAEHEGQTAYNAGLYFGAKQAGAASKTWVTRKDSNVRGEHKLLESKTVSLTDGFSVGESFLRFPGDPEAPPHLTMNCRCKLRFRIE
jgi:hypothetical protein